MAPWIIDHLRHICQHKLDIHPVHGNQEQIDALKTFFNFDEVDLEALNEFIDFTSNHGLDKLKKYIVKK